MTRSYDDEFARFVAARSRALLRTAHLLPGDPGAAEDLLQIALLKTYRHWPRLTNREAPDAFVRRVMVTSQASWWRRRRVREDSAAVVPERQVADATQAADVRDELWRVLARLPVRMRAVLVLRYWEDLSEAETARVLGCSAGTVKSQASRGLARLRTELAPSEVAPTILSRLAPGKEPT